MCSACGNRHETSPTATSAPGPGPRGGRRAPSAPRRDPDGARLAKPRAPAPIGAPRSQATAAAEVPELDREPQGFLPRSGSRGPPDLKSPVGSDQKKKKVAAVQWQRRGQLKTGPRTSPGPGGASRARSPGPPPGAWPAPGAARPLRTRRLPESSRHFAPRPPPGPTLGASGPRAKDTGPGRPRRPPEAWGAAWAPERPPQPAAARLPGTPAEDTRVARPRRVAASGSRAPSGGRSRSFPPDAAAAAQAKVRPPSPPHPSPPVRPWPPRPR